LSRRQVLRTSAVGLLAAGGAPRAYAQTIDKLAHIIVGFPAGGGTDIVARVLAQALAGTYATNIIVEDKPGASARLAVEYVKNAPPDGSVLLFTPDFPMTLYPFSFKSLAYDPLRDFIAVAPAAKGMLTLVVGPAVPADVKSLAGFIAWCKANPDKANIADTSAGATPHLTGVMLGLAAHVALTAVHYRGGAPAMEDLIGGHVPASVNPVSEVISFAKAGSIRALAVTGEKRSPFLPDVPTMKEQGFDVVVESYSGVFLPAKTPDAIVTALSEAMRKASRSQQMIESLAKFGTEPSYQTPAEFTATIKAEMAQWAPVVKASGFVATD
ncbi:MAG TPA: tripartite tricarboxylate transporter substrate-binding protein, partial [Xanthobacteraceae bacterium]|nr:tripartite tricarboxylate transporter substrate-binding protein [Xanthobacteraceae bacterium]